MITRLSAYRKDELHSNCSHWVALYVSKNRMFPLIFVRVFFADYPVQMAWTSRNFYELYTYIYTRAYVYRRLQKDVL